MLKTAQQQLSTISDQLSQSSTGQVGGGSFEWYDSILVEAVTRGRWLLIENAHVCNASVLDRLNSLLEPGGSLTVTERGVGEDGSSVVIKPHPNFRWVFSTTLIELLTLAQKYCDT